MAHGSSDARSRRAGAVEGSGIGYLLLAQVMPSPRPVFAHRAGGAVRTPTVRAESRARDDRDPGRAPVIPGEDSGDVSGGHAVQVPCRPGPARPAATGL